MPTSNPSVHQCKQGLKLTPTSVRIWAQRNWTQVNTTDKDVLTRRGRKFVHRQFISKLATSGDCRVRRCGGGRSPKIFEPGALLFCFLEALYYFAAKRGPKNVCRGARRPVLGGVLGGSGDLEPEFWARSSERLWVPKTGNVMTYTKRKE